MEPLPIDEHVSRIVGAARDHGAVVVVAPPGAGKTTRVPPALAADGPLILLQPRRIAARALARRIAEEQGWTVGEEVGWQVRFERRFSARTRLLVATEGILTARLQSDPLLSGFRTVVLDEFHERSLHGDLALALSREAARARQDLRLVVMSATLDAEPVARFLGGCPVMRVDCPAHSVEIAYRPGLTPAVVVREVLLRPGGHVVCFLPGAPEIRRVHEELSDLQGVRVLPLHGALPAEEQEAALAPCAERKVILATNVAETSLTIEGVTDVIDSGLHKVLRYDPAKGLDRLETERISRDSADQRSGRAGRTGPGRAFRLWHPADALADHREPEVSRVDLAGPLLEVLAWGGDPETFGWFEAPPRDALEAALGLLERLGAVRAGRLTPEGEILQRFPTHPRLARVVVAAHGAWRAAAACVLLSERLPAWSHAGVTTPSDVLSLVDHMDRLPPLFRQGADQIAGLARSALGAPRHDVRDDEILRALLAGYPDRVARRREPGSARLVLASGSGAVLARESGVREGEFLLALDLQAGTRGAGSEALVRLASGVEREWLTPTGRETVHVFDEVDGRVRAFERTLYDRLVIAERPVAPDPVAAADLLAQTFQKSGLGEEGEAVRRRLAFAGLPVDAPALVAAACAGATCLGDVDWLAHLPADVLRALARLAPETLEVPSGRRVVLHYREDGSVAAPVKLQELFGLAETPRLGPQREPVLFLLLAPNGRPVQTTRDLRSFWERTYPEVRKELRGRYPRHPWPEDPWTAEATSRAKRRG